MSQRRVAILFSGGPAPAANAVISSCASSFIDAGHEVVGLFHGYSNLQTYDRQTNPLLPDRHYRILTEAEKKPTFPVTEAFTFVEDLEIFVSREAEIDSFNSISVSTN